MPCCNFTHNGGCPWYRMVVWPSYWGQVAMLIATDEPAAILAPSAGSWATTVTGGAVVDVAVETATAVAAMVELVVEAVVDDEEPVDFVVVVVFGGRVVVVFGGRVVVVTSSV
jgi:hypothetical protein